MADVEKGGKQSEEDRKPRLSREREGADSGCARHERGERRIARRDGDQEPDDAKRDRRRPIKTERHADIGGHTFAAAKAEPDRVEMAEEGAEAGEHQVAVDVFVVHRQQAVLDRNFTRLIDLGGNIYFLVKLSNTDGWSAQQAVGSMTDLTPDEYAAMMRAGGRSPEGQKSKREQAKSDGSED